MTDYDILQSADGITFTFEGDYEVNALSVAKALEGLIEISSVIAKHNYPDVEFRLAVKAVTPGSLKFVFAAATQLAQTLMTPDNIEYAENLMEAIKTSFEIKQFLKGEKPKKLECSESTIKIEGADGQKMTISTANGVYFVNQSVDNSICNICKHANESPGVTGISLVHGKASPVKISRDEFHNCAKKIDIAEIQKTADTIEKLRKDEILFIRSPDFLGNSQWQFKSDRSFRADVKDKDFLQKVHSGKQSISAGMYIRADVLITMEMGEDMTPDENKCHYSVVKVHSIPPLSKF